MPLVLGIDTGGTYTDGVLLDPASGEVLHKAKTFTTKEELTLCIGRCLDLLPGERMGEVGMVCLSTTLATNAVVEGKGGRVGLILIGRVPDGELPTPLWRYVPGLLDIRGKVREALDEEAVQTAAQEFRGQVDAVAISCYAGVRNPAFELRAKELVGETLSVPVVCGHELSSQLGFQERTVTAVINGGLIPKIRDLVRAVQEILAARGITTPVMVVRGDGSLILDSAAVERPIDTLLSGPAASITGGLYLSGERDALLVDMGGTTTDIAYVSGGAVRLDKRGAVVGGWHTMVQAAAIATFGVGGDSRITLGQDGVQGGPRRALPFCVAAARWPSLARELEDFLELDPKKLRPEAHGTFYLVMREPAPGEEGAPVARALSAGPLSGQRIAEMLEEDLRRLHLERLERSELVQCITLTPTDLLHAAGELNLWDAAAARAAVRLFAAKLECTGDQFLERARAAITKALALAWARSAEHLSLGDNPIPGEALPALVERALDPRPERLMGVNLTLEKPVVALGAPVAAWMPEVCRLLDTRLIIPPHAEVANAVGAATGQVQVRAEALVRPNEDLANFSAYAPGGTRDFAEREAAENWALGAARDHALGKIREWGGVAPQLREQLLPRQVGDWEGNAVYIETNIVVEAVANPSAIGREQED